MTRGKEEGVIEELGLELDLLNACGETTCSGFTARDLLSLPRIGRIGGKQACTDR